MEGSIEGLQLQGKIVFVAHHPAVLPTFASGDHSDLVTGLLAGLRGLDVAQDFLRGVAARVCGEVAGDEATLSLRHMASGTLGRSEKERFTLQRISRDGCQASIVLK